MVLYADDESFTLMTPQGHMLAGWITFSATEQEDATVAQAQVLIRASDPLYEMGLTMGGHKQEDKFWQHTLRSLAEHFGEDAEVDTQVVCVDKKRQWRHAGNVCHSAAIRSSIYMMGAPVRGLKTVQAQLAKANGAHSAEPSASATACLTALPTRSSSARAPTGWRRRSRSPARGARCSSSRRSRRRAAARARRS